MKTLNTLALLLGVQLRRRERRERPHPPTRLSDEQVLEARNLHERDGLGPVALIRHFKLTRTRGTEAWLRGILDYRFRSSPSEPLDPKITPRRG